MSFGRRSFKKCQILPKYTFYTFIDEGERSGLKTISPHLKLVSGSNSLSAKGSWSLLPSTCKYMELIKLVCSKSNKIHKHSPKVRVYLSMFQKGHKCCGTFQCDTQFQSLWCSACTIPLLQASPSHKHLEAKTQVKNMKISNYITLNDQDKSI